MCSFFLGDALNCASIDPYPAIFGDPEENLYSSSFLFLKSKYLGGGASSFFGSGGGGGGGGGGVGGGT